MEILLVMKIRKSPNLSIIIIFLTYSWVDITAKSKDNKVYQMNAKNIEDC